MRIVMIDDDQLVTLSLKTILEAESGIEVVAVGHSGTDAIRLYKKERPDILLMDIRMEDMTGVEAAKSILSEFPDALILFLTTFLDSEYISQTIDIGVKGYLLKQDFDSIVASIKAVEKGQVVFGDEIVEMIPTMFHLPEKKVNTERLSSLTSRELEILQEVAEGLNNKEIAQKLSLSEGTVRNYVSVLLSKLALRDRTQLAIYYYKEK